MNDKFQGVHMTVYSYWWVCLKISRDTNSLVLVTFPGSWTYFIDNRFCNRQLHFLFHKHILVYLSTFFEIVFRSFFIQIVVDSDFEDSFHMEMKWKIRKCCSAIFFSINLMDIIKWNPMSIFLNVFIFITWLWLNEYVCSMKIKYCF